jgi:hypothetical protein
MKLDMEKCQVRWSRDRFVPSKLHGFETKPVKGGARAVAEKFLAANREALKITAAVEDIRFDRVLESLAAKKVLFQQYYRGVAIHGAWIAIHLDARNRISMVDNDAVPVAQLERSAARSGRFLKEREIDRIVAAQVARLGALATDVVKERRLLVIKGEIRPAWKVKFGTREPAASWVLFVDRIDGRVLEMRDVIWKATGKGRVFRPNPVVALDRDDLRDREDRDRAALEGAYEIVSLRGLDGSGFLRGPHVDTTATPRCAEAPDLKFLFSRKDRGFEQVMAYYHVDAFQRYLQALGFAGPQAVLARPIRVNAHAGRSDNSYYDPSPGRQDLNFGNGGVDDAEDAEVILHEYGHAIQDAVVPGFGRTAECRAMGEGFSDYFAASFFAARKPAARRAKIGEWDAKGYKGGPAECLRRLDTAKRYPGDMQGEEHADGEIWSACLWKVRGLLGRRKADTAILESVFYLKPSADFEDGAHAILLAEKNLYGGVRAAALKKIFRDRGIL